MTRFSSTARSGITASTDAFYAGQGRPSFKNYFSSQAKTPVSGLRAANVLCLEMESSTLFTLGRLFGVRTGALFAVLGNRMTDDFKADAVSMTPLKPRWTACGD